MSSDEPQNLRDLRIDGQNLYREELFTDLRVGSIRRLLPVREDGSADESREVLFMGQTHVLSEAGPLPVQCRIEARTLAEAIEKFPDAIQHAVERMIEEAREFQRREASRIIVPNAAGPKIDLG